MDELAMSLHFSTHYNGLQALDRINEQRLMWLVADELDMDCNRYYDDGCMKCRNYHKCRAAYLHMISDGNTEGED